MAAYRRVYDSRHPQADCQEPGSAPEPYARQSSTGDLLYRLTPWDGGDSQARREEGGRGSRDLRVASMTGALWYAWLRRRPARDDRFLFSLIETRSLIDDEATWVSWETLSQPLACPDAAHLPPPSLLPSCLRVTTIPRRQPV